MEDQKIQSFMQGQGGDWIKLVINLPAASHMGGIWERHMEDDLMKSHF